MHNGQCLPEILETAAPTSLARYRLNDHMFGSPLGSCINALIIWMAGKWVQVWQWEHEQSNWRVAIRQVGFVKVMGTADMQVHKFGYTRSQKIRYSYCEKEISCSCLGFCNRQQLHTVMEKRIACWHWTPKHKGQACQCLTTRGSCKTTVVIFYVMLCFSTLIYFVIKTTPPHGSRVTYSISQVSAPLWKICFTKTKIIFTTVTRICISSKHKGITWHQHRPRIKSHWKAVEAMDTSLTLSSTTRLLSQLLSWQNVRISPNKFCSQYVISILSLQAHMNSSYRFLHIWIGEEWGREEWLEYNMPKRRTMC